MLIFIDESGIHKKLDHSTIVLVYLEASNIAAIDQKVIEIEKNLKIPTFHWADFGSRRGWNIRSEFIEKISKLDFTFKIGVLQNPVNLSQALDNVLIYLLVEKNISKIVIDGKHPKWYERRIKGNLRAKGISVKKLRMSDDRSSPGLRLADALAGLVRSHYDKPTALSLKLYKMVENKITAHLVGGQVIR